MRFYSLLLLLPAAAWCQSSAPYSLATGSKLLLSLVEPVNSATARPGDTVYLVTDFPVAQHGRIVVPVGSTIDAVLTATTPSNVKSRAEMQIRFDKLRLPNGTSKSLNATLIDVSIEGASVKGAEGALRSTAGKPVPHCLGGLICVLTTRKYPNLVLPAHTALEVSLDKPIEFWEDELVARQRP